MRVESRWSLTGLCWAFWAVWAAYGLMPNQTFCSYDGALVRFDLASNASADGALTLGLYANASSAAPCANDIKFLGSHVRFNSTSASRRCALATASSLNDSNVFALVESLRGSGSWTLSMHLAANSTWTTSSVIVGIGHEPGSTVNVSTNMLWGVFTNTAAGLTLYDTLCHETPVSRMLDKSLYSYNLTSSPVLHVVIVCEWNGNSRIFLNGIEGVFNDSATSIPAPDRNATEYRLMLGSKLYSNRMMFRGIVYDFALWNRSLESDELTVLFATNENHQECRCAAGQFIQRDNFSEPHCKECPLGQYNALELVTKSESCYTCEFPKVALDSGTSECSYCSKGTYFSSSEKCEDCPPRTTTIQKEALNITDCVCINNHYGGYEDGDIQICISCDNVRGVICEGENLKKPIAKDGFIIDYQAKREDGSFIIYECFVGEACMNNTCSPLYTGEFCQKCEPGKSFRFGTRCYACISSEPALHFLYFLVAVLILLGTFLILRVSVPGTAKLHALGLTVSWLQILALFQSLPVDYPNSVFQAFFSLSIANFNFQFVSPECFESFTFWDRWIVNIFYPFIICGAAGIFFVYQILMEKYRPNSISPFSMPILELISCGKRKRPSIFRSTFAEDPYKRTRYVFFLIFVFTILYTHLSSTAFQPLNCRKQQADGKWYLVYSPDVECFTNDWYDRLPGIVFIFLLYPIAIPIILTLIYLKYEHRIFTDQYLAYFGGLVMPYHRQFYYWELVNIFRRAVLALLIDFFSFYPTVYVQLFFAISVLFILLVAQATCHPYKSREINILSMTWIITSVICLFAVVVFPSENVQKREKELFSDIIQVSIVLQNFLSIYVIVKEFQANRLLQMKELVIKENVFKIRESQILVLKKFFPTTFQTVWYQITHLPFHEQESILQEAARFIDCLAEEEHSKAFGSTLNQTTKIGSKLEVIETTAASLPVKESAAGEAGNRATEAFEAKTLTGASITYGASLGGLGLAVASLAASRKLEKLSVQSDSAGDGISPDSGNSGRKFLKASGKFIEEELDSSPRLDDEHLKFSQE